MTGASAILENPTGAAARPDHWTRTWAQAAPLAWVAVLALAGSAVWFAAVGIQALASSGDLWAAIVEQRSTMAGPALVVLVGAVFAAERRWPAVARRALARAHLVDAAYFVLFAVAVAPVLVVVQTGFALLLRQHASFLLLGRLPVVPRAFVAVAIILGIDAMNWVAHVANHRWRSLWRLHALHHSQEEMSVFTTFRTHPLIHVTYLLAVLPALVLGAGGSLPVGALVAYGCLVTLPHANLRWTFGPLGRVIVSPAYHRLHHARGPVGGQGAVNFGFVLVWWDQLAHRAVFPSSADAPVPTGIADRSVPLEQVATSFGGAGAVVAQLVQPFRRRAATDGPR